MAFPTTFAGWQAYIRDWLAADEFTEAQLNYFLDLAQLRLNREMESYGMEADTQVTLATATPFLITSLVADFKKIRLVSIPDVGPLDVLAINEIKAKLETNKNADASCPKNYCIDAGKLYIYPAQDVGQKIDIFYYKKIPYLSSGNPTNVFSTDYPDALLYASLLAAAPYMREDQDKPVWEGNYTVALVTANNESNAIKKGSTPLVRNFK